MVKKNKSQMFSTDIIVAVIILLLAALFLVVFKASNHEKEAHSVQTIYKQSTEESKLIISNLKSTDIINSKNEINVNKLLQLNEKELKQKLGIKNDFAIVFEKDGKLIKIDPNSNITCIGSSDLIVNNKNCVIE